METRLSLGKEGGCLRAWEEDGRGVIEAEREDDGRGLYKVFLLGREGRMPLGTMVPERGRLYLHRSFSREELERRGYWPVTAARTELAFPFQGERRETDQAVPAGWRREDEPGRLMGERLLRQCAGEVRGALLRREGESFTLAIPYRPDRPFPLAPLFCFARLSRLEGREYVLFRFTAQGCPLFPAQR